MFERRASGDQASLLSLRWSSIAIILAILSVGLGVVAPHLTGDGHLKEQAARAVIWCQIMLGAFALAAAAAAALPGVRRAILSKGFVFSIPLLSLLAFVSFKAFAGVLNTVYMRLVVEDGAIETAGTAALFLAAALLVWAGVRCWRSKNRLGALAVMALAMLCLVMGLEEINYGQRIFGFDTPPKLKAENYQESFNLHNRYDMEWLADELVPDLIIYWGLFGWLAAALIQGISGLPAPLKRVAAVAAPAWYIASFFLPYAIWANFDVCCETRTITISEDQEPAEAYLGLAMFAHALQMQWRTSLLSRRP
jgi:hypothetical protein